MRKVNFIYIGTENSDREHKLYSFFDAEKSNIKFIDALKKRASSRVLTSRPKEIPECAEREGTYYINRVEHLCVHDGINFYWFCYPKPTELDWYLGHVLGDNVCLSLKEEQALGSAYKHAYKLLSSRGRRIWWHYMNRKSLRNMSVNIRLARIRLLGK